jgi:hypothetical protein
LPSCVSAFNGNGWNDGLLYYDHKFRTDGNYTVYTSKRFSVMGNLSRYVRPGAVRHDVSGYHSRSGSWGRAGKARYDAAAPTRQTTLSTTKGRR